MVSAGMMVGIKVEVVVSVGMGVNVAVLVVVGVKDGDGYQVLVGLQEAANYIGLPEEVDSELRQVCVITSLEFFRG